MVVIKLCVGVGPEIGKYYVLLVNVNIYHSEVGKFGKSMEVLYNFG